jgi:hypothetical protein
MNFGKKQKETARIARAEPVGRSDAVRSKETGDRHAGKRVNSGGDQKEVQGGRAVCLENRQSIDSLRVLHVGNLLWRRMVV